MAPRWPKMRQDRPNIAPTWSQDEPTADGDAPKNPPARSETRSLTWTSLRDRFGAHFGVILGSFVDHICIILGSCWDHFGIILENIRSCLRFLTTCEHLFEAALEVSGGSMFGGAHHIHQDFGGGGCALPHIWACIWAEGGGAGGSSSSSSSSERVRGPRFDNFYGSWTGACGPSWSCPLP